MKLLKSGKSLVIIDSDVTRRTIRIRRIGYSVCIVLCSLFLDSFDAENDGRSDSFGLDPPSHSLIRYAPVLLLHVGFQLFLPLLSGLFHHFDTGCFACLGNIGHVIGVHLDEINLVRFVPCRSLRRETQRSSFVSSIHQPDPLPN